MTFAMFTSLRVWDKKKAVTAAFLSSESQVDLWFELQISYENIGDGNEASFRIALVKERNGSHTRVKLTHSPRKARAYSVSRLFLKWILAGVMPHNKK